MKKRVIKKKIVHTSFKKFTKGLEKRLKNLLIQLKKRAKYFDFISKHKVIDLRVQILDCLGLLIEVDREGGTALHSDLRKKLARKVTLLENRVAALD